MGSPLRFSFIIEKTVIKCNALKRRYAGSTLRFVALYRQLDKKQKKGEMRTIAIACFGKK